MKAKQPDCMYDLENDGVVVINGFAKENAVNCLLKEVLQNGTRSAAQSRNGAYARSVSPGRASYDIPDAANALRSCNLLELAIDIRNIIKVPEEGLSLKATMISGACDHDARELKLHSDNLDFNTHSMYRAILYLNDVSTDSGAFRYSRGSHKFNHQYSHYVENPECVDEIIECIGDAGTLVLFNAYGIHGRNQCIYPRYSISFEFIPEKLARRNNSVSILQGNLSRRVIENIDLFRIESLDSNGEHLYDDLTGKFWCPTTQYDYNPPRFTLSIRSSLRLVLNTAIARLTPATLQDKFKEFLRRLI